MERGVRQSVSQPASQPARPPSGQTKAAFSQSKAIHYLDNPVRSRVRVPPLGAAGAHQVPVGGVLQEPPEDDGLVGDGAIVVAQVHALAEAPRQIDEPDVDKATLDVLVAPIISALLRKEHER